MNTKWIWGTVLIAGKIAPYASAQQSCLNGVRTDGTVADPMVNSAS